MATIGEKIREIRQQRGLTQSELAGGVVTPSMISQIEADRARPSYNLLTSIANRLGMPIDYFMDEVDGQHVMAASITIAAYHLISGRPQQALNELDKMDIPDVYGPSYKSYLLTGARARRALGEVRSSLETFEKLREEAFRTQDRQLLYEVCKECGTTEFALGNIDGAIHEWKKALKYGTQLVEDKVMSPLDFDRESLSIYLQLHEAAKVSRFQTEDAAHYLESAVALAGGVQTYQNLADALIASAISFLDYDSGKARSFADRGLSLIECISHMEQALVARATANETLPQTASDPWVEIAAASTTVSSLVFLEAEYRRAEKEMDAQDYNAARNRLSRARDILHEYELEVPDLKADCFESYCTLRELEADLCRVTGQLQQSADILTELLQMSESTEENKRTSKWLANIVLLYRDLGDTAKVQEYGEKLAQRYAQDLPIRWVDTRG
ncbi:MAG: helix-turn-helix domain-containing protein [Alicyclobacillaceae bacterium]|jgi:transcriptional regulator with XRE-family HTH domain|nr:helix-turn-helix domain-containing protein [Alicyclobacillaceae bacterium]MCY0896288.1 helix-turn-helix domain-containing protein [Alicyclobacillaceae bacterium]